MNQPLLFAVCFGLLLEWRSIFMACAVHFLIGYKDPVLTILTIPARGPTLDVRIWRL